MRVERSAFAFQTLNTQPSTFNRPSPDERSSTGILTWSLTSLRPSRSFDQWLGPQCERIAIGVCISIQWRNRPGFSPGSLTLSCDDVSRKFRKTLSKSGMVLRARRKVAKNIFTKLWRDCTTHAELVNVTMKMKDIQEMRDVAPFKPFTLHLTSGRTIKITTPDHLLFSPRGDFLVVFPSAGGVCIVEPEHVDGLDLPRAA